MVLRWELLGRVSGSGSLGWYTFWFLGFHIVRYKALYQQSRIINSRSIRAVDVRYVLSAGHWICCICWIMIICEGIFIDVKFGSYLDYFWYG